MDANIQKYQAFVETVKSGSFTKSAEKLSYTQSGISRMIADLEKEWNITLLERRKNGLLSLHSAAEKPYHLRSISS